MFEFIHKGQRMAEIERAYKKAFKHHASQVTGNTSIGDIEKPFKDELQKVPCGKCETCQRLIHLLIPFQLRATECKMENDSIDRYRQQMFQKILKKCLKKHATWIKLKGYVTALHEIITRTLAKELTKCHVGKFTEQQKRKVREKVFRKWKEMAAQNDTPTLLGEDKERMKSLLDFFPEVLSVGHAKLIARCVLKTIQQLATQAVRDDIIHGILILPWMASTESIRYKYFKDLAVEVKNGNKDRALDHFHDPKRAIE